VEKLLLARHALSNSNREGLAWSSLPGEGLTPEGVEQARKLGAKLANENIDLGIATDLLRTQVTLELALDGRDVPRLVVSDLNEIDFGKFDGGPLEAYRTWAASHRPMVEAPGHGESRADAARRYADGLRFLLELTEPVVFFVGHALAIRYILDGARGLVPAPLITPVEHAVAYELDADEVRAASSVLEKWSRAPAFRPPPR
jgi:broad specificity phosphatase PhoE